MRVRIPLIIEESLIREIDEIAGEKHRRAATIEMALREYIAKHGGKTTAPAAPAAKVAARSKR